jgi:hypothetical protein
MDATGWPRNVVIAWEYKNDYGWDTCAPDGLLETAASRTGRHRADGRLGGGIDVEATFAEGRWAAGGPRDALRRLSESARGRWPSAAVDLVDAWSGPLWPTWDDLVAAAAPHMTLGQVATWLEVGRTVGWSEFRGRHRARGWQLDIPEHWEATVHPEFRSLMADGVWLPGWTPPFNEPPLMMAMHTIRRRWLPPSERPASTADIAHAMSEARRLCERPAVAFRVWAEALQGEGIRPPTAPRPWAEPASGARPQSGSPLGPDDAIRADALIDELVDGVDQVRSALAFTGTGARPTSAELAGLGAALDAVAASYGRAVEALYPEPDRR